MSQSTEEGSCNGDQGDRSAEEYADSEHSQHLRIEVPVEEVILLMPKPWLVVLVDFASHISKPG